MVTIAFAVFVAQGVPGTPLHPTPAHARSNKAKAAKKKADRKAKRAAEKQKKIDRFMFTAQYFMLRENDMKAAAKEYRKVLKLDRNHLHAGLALADIELREKRPKQALKLLTKMSRKHAKEGLVWHAIGRAHIEAGDSGAALEAYRTALKNNARDSEARWLVFELLNKRYRGGENDVKDELEQATKDYLRYTYYRKGLRYQIAERTNVELTGDKTALVIYDADQAYHSAFTDARMGTINQQMDKARKGYEQCLSAQPKNERCHYGLGMVYSSVKASKNYDRKKARDHFVKAASLPDAHVELAKLLRLEDDLQAAEITLKQALALDKHHQRAQLELAILHKLNGDEDKAIDTLVAAYNTNRFSSMGERAIDELVKLDPEHPLIKRRMIFGGLSGDVFSTDRFKAAISHIEQSLGGIDEDAPEKEALDKMLSRILAAADVDSSTPIRVQVLKTEMFNALATPNGNLYFTRGLLDWVKKHWPDRPIDENNDVIAHIMGHEVAHVIRKHALQSSLFQEAVKNASRRLDFSVLTHVTRLQEIEADRVGIVLASLAGYHPRGGIEVMEARGQIEEIPAHLDHPSFEERVHYLEEYWSNDVKYAFVSFKLGVSELKAGDKYLQTAPKNAAAGYRKAIEHFKRFRTTLKPTKAVLNNLAIAHAKLGMYALGKRRSPLHDWQTGFSIEKESALKYASVTRKQRTTRGAARRRAEPAIPKEIKQAIGLFGDALKRDPHYTRARVNLAAVHLAIGEIDKASKVLSFVQAGKVERGRLAALRGIIYAERKDYAKAEQAFRAAIRFQRTRKAGRYNLARVYELSGNKAKARKEYRYYLKKYATGPWAAAAKRALKRL